MYFLRLCTQPYRRTGIKCDKRIDADCIQETPKMEGLTARVLLVDAHEPSRRFVSQTLQQKPGVQIMGEACDGLEAVRRAEELKPDLILLDIGLPSLNGIAVAQRIRQLVPKAKNHLRQPGIGS